MNEAVDTVMDLVLLVLMIAGCLPFVILAFNVFLNGPNLGFDTLYDKSLVMTPTQVRQLGLANDVEESTILSVAHFVMLPVVDDRAGATAYRTIGGVDGSGNRVPREHEYALSPEKRLDRAGLIMGGWNAMGNSPLVPIGSLGVRVFHVYATSDGSLRWHEREGGTGIPGYAAGTRRVEPEYMGLVN